MSKKAKDAGAKQDSSLIEIINRHKNDVLNLLRLGHQLPSDIVVHLIAIGEFSKLMLKCMAEDPRDFDPANKFFSRYLPTAKTIVEQINALLASPTQLSQFEVSIEKARVALDGLAKAFEQQYHRLLENDAQDLSIETGLLERLLKMEGFK